MKFAHPAYLAFCILGAGVAVFCVWSVRSRKKAWRRFVAQGLEHELTQTVSFSGMTRKLILSAAACALIALALMRPQWGFQWQKAQRSGVDILLAVDTSRSMLARDILPSRFERTKFALKDFVRTLSGDRVGLIAFSGSAFLQCPLTVDYGGFLLTLDDLSTDSVPRGGTDLARAIRGARRAFEAGEKKYRVLVVISDGESHSGDALAAAEEARREGIVIHCIGVGTPEGELIKLQGAQGSEEFLKDASGNVIKSRLDEALLKQVAFSTGGSYIRASSADFGLASLYREKISSMEKREFEERLIERYHERFQIPLFVAFLFLLAELFVPTRKPANLVAAFVYFGLFFLPVSAVAADGASFADTGNRHYRAGDYRTALDTYRAGLEKDPESDVLHFNAGTASYQLHDFSSAARSFERALLSDSPLRQAQSRYNLGSAHYRMGISIEDTDTKQAVGLLRQSLEQFRKSVEENPRDRDAQYNYEFVKKELQRLEEKQQQQEQNQQQDQQQDQQKQEEQNQEKNEEDGHGEQQPNQQQDDQQQGDQPQEDRQHDNRQDAEQDSQEQSAAVPQEMSPEEARQLLDGYEEEKSMQYLLDERQGKPEGTVLKDW